MKRDPVDEQRQCAIAAADAAMQTAKRRFSLAALACLRRELGCEALVQQALHELDSARALLCTASEKP
jgi:hypothetical protein